MFFQRAKEVVEEYASRRFMPGRIEITKESTFIDTMLPIRTVDDDTALHNVASFSQKRTLTVPSHRLASKLMAQFAVKRQESGSPVPAQPVP